MNYIFIIFISLALSGCSFLDLQKNSDRDSDRDGVLDMYDLCENTSLIEQVDKTGCPLR